MRSILILIPLLSLLGCSVAPSRPVKAVRGDYSYAKQYLEWYIPRQMKKHDVPGVSIALVEGDKILWARGFGYADLEKNIPATPDTIYQVGSVSKIITATAVMQQVERGRIDLDAPIQKYLPEFSIHSRWKEHTDITPRALLSHHSGLPSDYLKGFFSAKSLDTLIKELAPEHLAYPPGQVFNYSNLGADLLGTAVERVAGRPFVEHTQKALLDRIGMTHSSYVMTPSIHSMLARGYIDGQASDPIGIRDIPAGSLLSSAADMGRYLQFVFSGGRIGNDAVLGEKQIAAMFQPQYPDRPLDFGQRFGLGWMLSGLKINGGGTVAWHDGSTRAFMSQIALLPEKKLGVVILANSDTAGALVYDVSELALALALEARDGIEPLAPPARKTAVAVGTDTLKKYAGDYSLKGALANISLNGDRLEMRVLDHVLELVPESDTEFHAEIRLLGLVSIEIPFPKMKFVRAEGRDFLLLQDHALVAAEKIPSYPVSKVWRERIGDYYIVNPDKHYLVNLDHCRMLVENGKLLLDIKISGLNERRVKVVVVPLSDDEVYVFGLGRNVGDVARMERDGEKTRMWYSGYLFERKTAAPVAQAIARHSGNNK